MIKVATDLGETTLCDLLAQAQLAAEDVGQLVTTTVTGMVASARALWRSRRAQSGILFCSTVGIVGE